MQTGEDLYFEQCNFTHADLLHDIAIQSYNENYKHVWEDQGQAYLNRFYDKSIFKKELTASACQYYIIHSDGRQVGFFKLRDHVLSPHEPEECLELNKIYILNAFTGMGTGQKALDFIVDLARRADKSILWLNVMDKSRAKAFYEKNGFERCHEVALDYPFMKSGLNVLATYKRDITKS